MHTYCIFSAQFLPTLGGVERYSFGLAKKMIENGDHAIIVTSGAKELLDYEVIQGVEVYRLPTLQLAGGRLPVVKKNKGCRQVMKLLAKKNIERVIIQTRLYTLSILGLAFCRENDIPCIVIEHGSGYTVDQNPIKRVALRLYEDALVRRAKRYNPRFFCVSKYSMNWLKHFGIQAEGVLYNSVDWDEIQQLLKEDAVDFREKYRIPADNICVSYAGRLIPEKGPIELSKAVVHYNNTRTQQQPELTLFIAGVGSLNQSDFPNNKNVILLGGLPFNQVVALYKSTEIFCLPTMCIEGFPTSLLEAAACNNFLVATAKGGVNDLICGEEYGIATPDNSPKLLAAALSRAANDSEYRSRAVFNTAKRVKQNFTFDTLYEKVKTIW